MRQLHYIFATLSLALVGVILPDDVVAQYYPERRMVRKGNEQFDARNYRKSYNLYQDAYKVDSTQYEVLYNRANGYYHNAIGATSEEFSIEESNAMYERIAADTLLSDVQRAEVFRNLGESLFMQQKYEEALNSFRESLRLNPNDSETKYNYVLTKRIVDQKRAMQNQNQDQNQNQNQNGGGGSDSENQDQSQDQNQDQNQGQGDGEDQQNNDDQNNPDKDDKQEGQGDEQDKEGESDPQSESGDNDDNGDEEQDGGTPQPRELSPDKERMLDAIQAEEDKTQEKLNDSKKGVIIPGKKNW